MIGDRRWMLYILIALIVLISNEMNAWMNQIVIR